MIFEDIEKLIKTMKKNDIYSIKTPDIEIIAKATIPPYGWDSSPSSPQSPPEPQAYVDLPADVDDKIKKITAPITDEQLLFTPFYGLEGHENG